MQANRTIKKYVQSLRKHKNFENHPTLGSNSSGDRFRSHRKR